jgi:hypothetical protein
MKSNAGRSGSQPAPEFREVRRKVLYRWIPVYKIKYENLNIN